MSSRRAFRRGLIACFPIAISVVPFGVIAAVSANEAGLGTPATAALSLVVFAGASQLAALELAKNDAPALFVIGAALIVNLRFVIYSASLSPRVRGVRRRLRVVMSYLLTDQAFAVSVPELDPDDPAKASGVWFFFGAAFSLWFAWQSGTWIGIVLGTSVPPELSLDFSVALAFIALTVPHIKSRPALAAAAASIGTFILSQGLPHGLALIPATFAGIAVGMATEALTS